MGKDLVPADPAVFTTYAVAYEAQFDATYEGYIDLLPADEVAIETSLEAADEEALESGIASVFDELRTAAEEPTYALLAELNRIWSAPLAA